MPLEGIPILTEIDVIADHRDTFRPQPQFLLEAIFAGEKNPAFRPENSVPWNRFATGPQRPHDLPGGSGIPARRRNVAVGRDSALWNPPDYLQDSIEHQRVRNFSSTST